MTIIYWTASWLSGIWLASNWQMPWFFWLILCVLGLLAAILLRRMPYAALISISLALLCLGAVRYGLAVLPPADNHVANFNGAEELTVRGIVAGEPDIRESITYLVVEAESLSLANGSTVPVVGQVLVYVPHYPVIAYGSRLQMSGTLKAPQNRSDFDYEQYLARRDIFSEMSEPAIVVLETGLGNPLIRALLAIKGQAKETIDRLFPEPQAALLNGIILGYGHDLPKELADDFQATGMTHIIAISGFNIAIIAGILLLGSRHFVSPRIAGLTAIAGITLYTIFVGAEPSVVRAAIMGAMLIVALLFLGRPTFLFASLFAAALFMTLINPLILWDVGFQLSFMAVLGLMLYVGPWSKRISDKLEPRLGEAYTGRVNKTIADVLLATMAAIIMTLPVMLFHFDSFSLISPLANLLILPAQPGVMVLGGLATMMGMIALPIGQVVAWAAWLLLTYTINMVRFFATLPFSSIDISLPAVGVIAISGFMVALSWISGQDKEKRLDILGHSRRSRILRLGIAAFVFSAILAGMWLWHQPDGRMHVTFFDVGQGDAIFIETPQGRQIVVDGGRYPSRFLDKLGQEIPFWDKGIDIMVATHPDEDHTLGLTDTFDHYRVDLLLVNGEETTGSDSYAALLEKAGKAQTSIHRALAGEVIELGDGVRLEILHPGSELEVEQRNENSVALRLVYGDFAVLLTGDAEEGAEQVMMASGRPLQSTIFKAGHHGSRSSSSRTFLQAVQPQIIIISSGKDNRYDHPHPEVLQRAEEIGAAVLRTDELGTIEIISNGSQVWWETRR